MLDDLKVSKPHGGVSHGLYCKARALFWAREGRYSNALQALSSQGVAGHDDYSAYEDLLHRHPSSPCPDVSVLPSKPVGSILWNGTEQNDGLNYGTERFPKLKPAAYHC